MESIAANGKRLQGEVRPVGFWPGTAMEWLRLAAQLLALVSAVAAPFVAVIKKYKKALDDALKTLNEQQKAIENQREINREQADAIDVSIEDRRELREKLDAICDLTMTQVRIKITKIAEVALARGTIHPQERATLKALWEPYKENHGNHLQAGRIEAALALTVSCAADMQPKERI